MNNSALNKRKTINKKYRNFNDITAFGLATTFVGTLAGAGFASGQELLQFFCIFGFKGIVGMLIATILFILIACIIMVITRNLNSSSYDMIIIPFNNRLLKLAVNTIISFFLFGFITVMMAGSGVLFSEQLHINSITGSIILGILTIVTTLFGTDGIIKSFNVVVPIMLILAIFTAVVTLVHPPHISQTLISKTNFNTLNGNWLTSAILFVSYNIIVAISVLAPLGQMAKEKKIIVGGSILGGLSLGLTGTVLCITIIKNLSIVHNTQMPMIFLAQFNSNLLGWIYSIVLFLGIYTTAVGCMFALSSRVKSIKRTDNSIFIVDSVIIAIIASQFGFSNLVRYLYPLNGYFGLILLVGLIYNLLIILIRRRCK